MKIPRDEMLVVQLGAILFMAVGIVVAGWWSDKTTPARVLMAGCAATVPLGMVFGVTFGTGDPMLMFLSLSVAMILMGFTYGPLGAWLTSRFPPRVRYTGASFAFNVAGIVGGGFAPNVAQLLVANYGVSTVGYWLTAAGLLSLVGLGWLTQDE
jgi:MFS family permease